MKELHSEIEIHASAGRVWQLLTDFEHFPEWNPFIQRAAGQAKVGARLEVYIRPPASSGMTFKPTVLKAEANHELRWLGHLLLPGLFDGEHIFIIETLGAESVRFTQREVFKGLFVPFLANSFYNKTQAGFEAMNQSLKARAEQV